MERGKPGRHTHEQVASLLREQAPNGADHNACPTHEREVIIGRPGALKQPRDAGASHLGGWVANSSVVVHTGVTKRGGCVSRLRP